MREKLLEVLAEPTTGASLRLEATRGKGDRIEEGRLVSEVTGKSYPIVRGIPRFVESEGYTGSFGKQWNLFREVQLDGSTGGKHSVERFDAEAGWTSEELRDRWVLDAGCGAGRFSEVVAARGPNLVSLDYSSAVEAAARTVERFPNVDVVQASLLDPPLRQGVFDYAYCIGVIQHTPDPPAVVRNVVKVVKPGGKFSLTIYARQPWTKLNTKYLIRPLTKRMPQQVLLRAIEGVMPVAFPLSDVLFKAPVVGRIGRFVLPVANYHRPGYTRQQRYQEAVLDTFDMLSPQYDSPMTAGEVESELRTVRARTWNFRTRVPVNVVGER